MQTKWENLFWFQRSDDKGEEQLENNTTKSFLKVLDETDNSLTEDIVSEMIDEDIELSTVDFETQKSLEFVNKLGLPTYLVGLSYTGNSPKNSKESNSDSGLVDGLLVIEDQTGRKHSVVLEVKTGTDELRSAQMSKYRNELDPAKETYFTWTRTYSLLEDKFNQIQKEKDRFLLREFLQYMELMDMVPFKGFDREQLQQNYKQYIKDSNQMQATYSGNKGSFARALKQEIDDRPNSPLSNFEIVSNQYNTQVHLMKKEHFEDEDVSFPKVNHFTIGFWRDKLNIQLNIRKRLMARINERGSVEPKKEFIDAITQTFPRTVESELMTDDNPLIYNRLERNIQQKTQTLYDTTAFDIYTFTYHKDFGIDLLKREIGNLTEANRTARDNHIGNQRCLGLAEKRIPFESELIAREDLPKLCIDYFEILYLLFEYFEK